MIRAELLLTNITLPQLHSFMSFSPVPLEHRFIRVAFVAVRAVSKEHAFVREAYVALRAEVDICWCT
jgi:hypothetical protein